MWQAIELHTSKRCEFVDITDRVRAAVAASGVQDGLCVAYVPHTTAGVTINESADPDVAGDILLWLEEAVPRRDTFRHAEGNSDSHVKASLMGCSATLIIRGGRPVLGTWQGVFFCEFDGPRRRQCYLQILPAHAGGPVRPGVR